MPHNTANATVTAFNTLDGLDCFPFARHYLGNHYCFLFHRVLRCFSSPGYLHTSYFIQMQMILHYQDLVAQFGDPRVLGYFHLSVAYRR